jgi:hypothetical protein
LSRRDGEPDLISAGGELKGASSGQFPGQQHYRGGVLHLSGQNTAQGSGTVGFAVPHGAEGLGRFVYWMDAWEDRDRDRKKRPIMGEIGVRLADIAVITSDNPRTEKPVAILQDILEGVGDAQNFVVIENRVDAIHYAMEIAKKDDIIVLAGKGHETYQEVMGIKYHMDEREIVAEYLES